jgi:hypothetical protein
MLSLANTVACTTQIKVAFPGVLCCYDGREVQVICLFCSKEEWKTWIDLRRMAETENRTGDHKNTTAADGLVDAYDNNAQWEFAPITLLNNQKIKIIMRLTL